MAQQVVIDEDECVGCEACVEACPEVFGFDGDTEKAHVLENPNLDADCIEEAVASCPAECITME
jgi:ferredoxin